MSSGQKKESKTETKVLDESGFEGISLGKEEYDQACVRLAQHLDKRTSDALRDAEVNADPVSTKRSLDIAEEFYVYTSMARVYANLKKENEVLRLALGSAMAMQPKTSVRN